MIITRTPFRVSFAGGGSDLASFYTRREGCVLSTCINKYMYVMIHPSFDPNETTIKYRKTEIVRDIRDIQHPIAREVLMEYGLKGVEVVSVADLPSGTGLASSSAFTVGMLHAVNAYRGRYKSQEFLAQKACEVEIEKLGEPIGKQDQYGVSVGGMKFIRFLKNEEVHTEQIFLSREVEQALEDNLLLLYTGMTRSASAILEEQNRNTASDEDKFNNLAQMTGLAMDLRAALHAGDTSSFGEILHRGWLLKREMASGITDPMIDDCYRTAMENGALGGKLLGAGGGGFLLLYCEKARQKRLLSALYKLRSVPFAFDHEGTKVIHVGNKDW